MTKIISIVLILFYLPFYSCVGQHKKESNNTLIDPIESTPFEIKRDRIFMPIPDSLRSDGMTGLTAIELFIAQSGKIEGFNIKKFFLMTKKDTLVNYFDNNQMIKDRSSYPTKIQSYYELLSNYIDNIEIVKVYGTKPKKVNKITILIRFN